MLYPTRVLMDHLYNLRDLGGLATRNQKITLSGRFLRSDAPFQLSERDLQVLSSYPLKTVVDLRSQNEIDRAPHALKDKRDIHYYHVPLLGEDLDNSLADLQPENPEAGLRLSDIYIHILRHGHINIFKLFEVLGNADEGAVLVHCTHGKDRTGLAAMLLLLLADVSDSDIIANYQVSATYLKPLIQKTKAQIPQDMHELLNSDAANMQRTLAFFHDHYTSAQTYLEACGVSSRILTKLRTRLTGESSIDG